MAIILIDALCERFKNGWQAVLRTRATCAKRLLQREPARALAFHANAHNKGIHPRMKRLAAGLHVGWAAVVRSSLKPMGAACATR